VYTGTHDNDTLVGWYRAISPIDRQVVRAYAKIKNEGNKEIVWKLISIAMGTRAKLCVIPMQDYLGLGSRARINTPSTLGENWKWRLKAGEFTDALCKKIHKLTLEKQR
jgi:4-alpha-glucanotransferase